MAQVALTYSYVYLGAGGPHERRPVRTPGGPGGFELISQKSGGTLQPFPFAIPTRWRDVLGRNDRLIRRDHRHSFQKAKLKVTPLTNWVGGSGTPIWN